MAAANLQILVTVADPALNGALANAGFGLQELDGASVIDTVRGQAFDLVLLGFEAGDSTMIAVCRHLRGTFPDIGIVMVRSGGTFEDDVSALDAGADDCISAPFRFREIVARLTAVLRRCRITPGSRATLLRVGDLALDIQRRRLWRGSTEIHLSPREFTLMLVLMEHAGVTLTHMKLFRAVWGDHSPHTSGCLRAYIKALRGKIEADPTRPEFIVTEHWVGYRLHNPAQNSIISL